MSFLQPRGGRRDSLSVSVRCWKVLCTGRIRRTFSLSPLLFLALSAPAQQQSQANTSDQPQNSNTWDCSDPLLASSPQCSGQSQGSQLYGAETRLPGSSLTSPQPELQTRSYSDLESLSRQSTQRNANTPQRIPPEPLTEFQKFVATTNGQVLPVFGASLFENVPSTFAPLDMVPVPADYIIGPGDELRVRVWGHVNFQSNVRVDRSGEIYIPVSQIGPVHVAGIPVSELEGRLRDTIGRVYRNFEVQADVGKIRAIQVYVAGEARRPGVYTISSLSTMIDALFASGGPSVQGSLRHIQLRRQNQTVTDLDLYAFLIRGDKSADVKLESGDVIFIPPAGPQAAATGSVRVPAIYELLPKETLSDLIADAGGPSTVAAESRVSIERIEEHTDRHAMEVAYDASGLATPVAEGDLVRVFSIVPRYKQTVTLRGNIANPGRFAWHAGMHVSELIPDKDSLITRNYWWKRAQLGLPAPEFEPIPGFGQWHQPSTNNPVNIPPPQQEGEGSGYPPNEYNRQNPGDQYGQNGQFDQYGQNGQQQDQSQYPNQYPNQNQYPYANPQQQNQLGLEGQQQNPYLTNQQRASTASVAVQQPDASSRFPRSTPKTTIAKNAPDVDWDYAVIERLDPDTLKTVLVPFDLGKLVLDHDASQDLALQPGDVVSILSEADIRIPIAQQTKLVKLEGEFAHAGLYTVQPGETLRQLVERAGGLTQNAYLYGSEFTRESTRNVQQARIDEYVQSLDLRIQRSALNLAASGVATTQQASGSSGAQGNERQLISRLRQIRATGRIVLEFNPGTSGAANLPNITMEDGDHFVIPHVPASVNIVGAVNDQTSFLYKPGRHVRVYLRMAGGLTKDADRKRAFVIRANGEVVGYATSHGLWGNQFEDLPIYPGDTIVIPEKTFKIPALRGFLDWAQLFSQLALGAASISILR